MINRLQDASAALGPEVDALKEKALDFAASAKEGLAIGSEAVKDFTIKQPAKALGIALGMGVALGWLLKRR